MILKNNKSSNRHGKYRMARQASLSIGEVWSTHQREVRGLRRGGEDRSHRALEDAVRS